MSFCRFKKLSLGPPGFEPGSSAPKAEVITKLHYGPSPPSLGENRTAGTANRRLARVLASRFVAKRGQTNPPSLAEGTAGTANRKDWL